VTVTSCESEREKELRARLSERSPTLAEYIKSLPLKTRKRRSRSKRIAVLFFRTQDEVLAMITTPESLISGYGISESKALADLLTRCDYTQEQKENLMNDLIKQSTAGI
jgi:hypothetical protein